MKTIIPLELDDDQRRRLAGLIDGRPGKRLATRAEIVDACRRALDCALDPQRAPDAGTPAGDWPAFDDYLAETCGAVFGAHPDPRGENRHVDL